MYLSLAIVGFYILSAGPFLVILLLLRFLLLQLLLELLLVVDFFEAGESGLGRSAALALYQVDPDEVGALGFADLLRTQKGEAGTFVQAFHVSHRLSTVINRMQKLAPLAVVAVPDLGIVELLAQLRHVVGGHVLFLLQLPGAVCKTTVVAEFAFSKMNNVLTHFRFFLFLYVVVEFLPFLGVCKLFFQFFAGGLAIFVKSGTGLVT